MARLVVQYKNPLQRGKATRILREVIPHIQFNSKQEIEVAKTGWNPFMDDSFVLTTTLSVPLEGLNLEEMLSHLFWNMADVTTCQEGITHRLVLETTGQGILD